MTLLNLLLSILPTQRDSSPWQEKRSASLPYLTSVHQLHKGPERRNFIPVHIWWWDWWSGAVLGAAHVNPGVTDEKRLCCFCNVTPESLFPQHLIPSLSGIITTWPRRFFPETQNLWLFSSPKSSDIFETVRGAEKWWILIYKFFFF